ncbi:MAG: 3-phosphoshikimate 1-carboxyvinyltransferase [Pelagibacterales bacterium]|nr:3-phosphoshikimate 1-carboxyvinyltransferase [Pelagibacterales bacterium]
MYKKFSVLLNKRIKKFNTTISPPGDKSISNRFFFVASQAMGISEARGILDAEDVLNNIKIFQKLGVKIIKKKNIYYVYGNGLGSLIVKDNLKIYAGNAGTVARCVMGLLAPYPKKMRIFGDESLSRRDFYRCIEPLEKLGCSFYPKGRTTLPLTMTGSNWLAPLNKYQLTYPSAQVKTCCIFASLLSPGISTIKEPNHLASRTHTEILLNYVKASLKVKKFKKFNLLKINGLKNYKAFKLNVPGDVSAAAFFIALSLLTKNSKIKIKDVNLNPFRTGFIKIIKLMQGKVFIKNKKIVCGEHKGDIIVKGSNLKSVNCPSSISAKMIDEYPIAMICAAKAKGVSNFYGLEELNKKESKRLNVCNEILNKIGVKTKLGKDKIKIYGNPNLKLDESYIINTYNDHRIAKMAFVAGQAFIDKGNMLIKNFENVNTSFPNFLKIMKKLNCKYEVKKNK